MKLPRRRWVTGNVFDVKRTSEWMKWRGGVENSENQMIERSEMKIRLETKGYGDDFESYDSPFIRLESNLCTIWWKAISNVAINSGTLRTLSRLGSDIIHADPPWEDEDCEKKIRSKSFPNLSSPTRGTVEAPSTTFNFDWKIAAANQQTEKRKRKFP